MVLCRVPMPSEQLQQFKLRLFRITKVERREYPEQIRSEYYSNGKVVGG